MICRIFFCGLFAIFLNIGITFQAQALECPRKMPKVLVKTLAEKTQTIERVSIGGLSRLHGGSYRPGDPSVMGLGGGRIEMSVDVDFAMLENGSLQCVGIESLNGTFKIYPSILIAQNYRKNSCEYKAIMEHEMEHINILKRFQSLYAAQFRMFLRSVGAEYAQSSVTASVNSSFFRKQIEQDIHARTQAYIQKIMPVLQERQLALDSPEEYARVQAKCTNWAQ